MKIKANPGLCEGHGLCRRFAPDVYHLDDEGYLDIHIMAVPPGLEHQAELGASVCPAGAIQILREPGDPPPLDNPTLGVNVALPVSSHR
jgi:ferredoxin